MLLEFEELAAFVELDEFDELVELDEFDALLLVAFDALFFDALVELFIFLLLHSLTN